MSKRTRDEYRKGPGTRGPIVRERTPQVIPEPDGELKPGERLVPGAEQTPDNPLGEPLVKETIADKAEEDLTALGEMEDKAESEAETAELDSNEGFPPGSKNGEASPMGFSTGGID